MKLTNYTRDAFISSVMNDVPVTDYYEQARKAFLDAYMPTQPKQVQELWASNTLRPYLETTPVRICGQRLSVPSCGGYQDVVTPIGAQAEMTRIQAAYEAQKNTRDALRTKLYGAAYACTTTKMLRELLPEFDRYLPAEEEKTSRQLPVVQNIMADFVKAGWPAKKAVKK